jgi:glyoxylase-like metal-dependent hydrolase (beta-lactamase superfamily II)
VRWRITGTFGGERPYMGVEPNGAPLDLVGVDVVRVADGRIVRVDAFTDSMAVANQIGVIPPRESAAGQRLTALFNRRTRMGRRLMVDGPERVADGVWVLRGGFPAKSMNVYFLEEDGGVTLFDAGISAMTRAVASAGVRMGGIRRVVLGHSHTDHRGTAPGLGVPVLCHPAERADAEGDGGLHYFDYSKLESPLARVLMPRLLRWWDGGPVSVADTVDEGDEVAGFEVVHLPGHAPGLIGLWRKSDRLALASDCFYTLDPQTGRHGAPRVPHRAFNPDHEQARASIRKLAALEPATVWAGHAEPVTGDVRAQLERAADET